MEEFLSERLMSRSAVFRVDASLHIGTGHVMRCLTLASELARQQYQILFICRPHIGNLIDKIKSYGYGVETLPETNAIIGRDPKSWLGVSQNEDAGQTSAILADRKHEWLIVDHYAIDSEWETRIRRFAKKLLVIDDLANRLHNCDLLLDQNLGRKTIDYDGLVPPHCQLLIGSEFALLRPEFRALRSKSLYRRNKTELCRWLISLGGVDAQNHTTRVLQAMREARLSAESRITVVLGRHAPHLEKVRKLCEEMPWPTILFVDHENIAELMADSDIAVGAAGSSSWERACLGLPTLMLVLAENQRTVALSLEKYGAASILDPSSITTSFLKSYARIMENKTELQDISVRSSRLTEGFGRNLVVQRMMNLERNVENTENLCSLRLIQEYDLDQILQWRNHPAIRLNMLTQHEISKSEHLSWWRTSVLDPTRACYVFRYSDIPLGIVTLSNIDVSSGAATWGFYVAPGAEKGVGLLLGITAMHHFFEIFGLQMILSFVLDSNEISKKFHERLGFGLTAENPQDDSRKNATSETPKLVHYSISKAQWLSHQTKLSPRIHAVTTHLKAHYLH